MRIYTNILYVWMHFGSLTHDVWYINKYLGKKIFRENIYVQKM